MISFDLPAARFSFRAVGIALHAGYVLMHRAEGDDFWSLPGGRCKAMEEASRALVREMREELGVEVAIERLVWVVENFFALGGRQRHELGFYFLMRLPPGSLLLDVTRDHRGQEHELALTFRWLPLDALGRERIEPTFLRTRLQRLPEGIEHVVERDEDAPPP